MEYRALSLSLTLVLSIDVMGFTFALFGTDLGILFSDFITIQETYNREIDSTSNAKKQSKNIRLL